MRDDDSLREGLGAALIGFFVLAVVVVIVVVGWQIGWWFKTNDAKRQGTIENINSHNLRKNFGFQQNLRSDITKNIGNVKYIGVQITQAQGDAQEQAALRAQAKAILAIVCEDAVQVAGDPLPAIQQNFINANCDAGTVSVTSQFNKGVNP